MKKKILENPIMILTLGLSSALMITSTFENAYTFGFIVLIMLLCSNFIISLIGHFIPSRVKLPVYVIIVATLVTIPEILIETYIPSLYQAYGIYLPIVMMMLLSRAISVATKKKPKESVIDALKIGSYYLIGLIIISLIREILGSGTITLMSSISSLTGYISIIKFPHTNIFPMYIFDTPAGSFIIMGLMMVIVNKIGGYKNESN